MPDITMCDDSTCPMAKDCKRSTKSGTRPSDYMQSWFEESPRNRQLDTCEQYYLVDRNKYFT